MQRVFNETANETYQRVGDILNDFCKKVIEEDRCLSNHKVFDMLIDIHNTNIMTQTIHKCDEPLYRARLINEDDFLNPQKVGRYPFEGYSKIESGAPPVIIARALRANYDGISYLYCSSTPYGAMAEVRPSLNSKISLAKIVAKEDIRLFPFAYEQVEQKDINDRIALLLHISYLFAKPIGVNDLQSDYYPTQRIANFIKSLGYDGITYNSSFDRYAENICIFNKEKCKVINSQIYTLGSILYDFVPTPTTKNELIEITNEVSELASEIHKKICAIPLPYEIPTIEKLDLVYKKITGKSYLNP